MSRYVETKEPGYQMQNALKNKPVSTRLGGVTVKLG